MIFAEGGIRTGVSGVEGSQLNHNGFELIILIWREASKTRKRLRMTFLIVTWRNAFYDAGISLSLPLSPLFSTPVLKCTIYGSYLSLWLSNKSE